MLSKFEIQRRQRLIEQQHLRLCTQGPGYSDPLLLPARQFMDHLFSLTWQGHQLQELVSLFAARGFVDSLDFKRKRDVLPHAHQREQCEILEDQRRGPVVRPDTSHILTANQDATLTGRLKTGNCPKQRGLPTAGGTEKTEKFTPLDRQTGIPDGDEIAELDPHIIELNVCTHRMTVYHKGHGADPISAMALGKNVCPRPKPGARLPD